MRTTLTIRDALLDEAVRRTGTRSRSGAVNAALAEWSRLRKLQELRALRGTMDLRAAATEELRALEVAETDGTTR